VKRKYGAVGWNDTGLVVVREYINVPFANSSPLPFEERKDREVARVCDAEGRSAVAYIDGVRAGQLKEVGDNFRGMAFEVDCVNPELGAVAGGETPMPAYLR
jgi:hypothetical protein